MSELALYVHVPFCRKKCPYCAFFKEIWSENRIQAYVHALEKEVLSYQDDINDEIISIFFGGGTPSLLLSNQLASILGAIRKKFNVIDACEVTLEANPETITEAYLYELEAIGINRISLGVQSFLDDELTFLGREHTKGIIEKALTLVCSEVFSWVVNIDLMFSLPDTRVESVAISLDNVLKYEPEHISAYSLTIESGTPFDHRKVLPSPYSLEQYRYIQDSLALAGYDNYEVSAFAKQGYRCRHNLQYWRYQPFIGFGPSAVSFFRGCWYENTRDVTAYIDNPVSLFSLGNVTELTLEKQMTEYILSNLRLTEGINFSELADRFGIDLRVHFKNALDRLLATKLIHVDDNAVRVTKEGRYLLDTVLMEFVD